MSGKDKVEYDEGLDAYYVRTGAGVLNGTELGGNPLAFDTHAEARGHIKLRAENAKHHAEFLRERHRWGWP